MEIKAENDKIEFESKLKGLEEGFINKLNNCENKLDNKIDIVNRYSFQYSKNNE